MNKKQVDFIIDELWGLYPDADCTLDDKNHAWQLLIAGILASQCTDARVNTITPHLFAKYPTIEAMSKAPIDDLENIIRSCGFFRAKASYINGSMNRILEVYDGKVPETMEELITLPGVGRKIANLLLGDAFGVQAIVVDTHCARVSKHLGFTKSTNPQIIERDLMKWIPKDYWIGYGHRMVAHGRALCVARRPRCGECSLASHCVTGRKYLKENASK